VQSHPSTRGGARPLRKGTGSSHPKLRSRDGGGGTRRTIGELMRQARFKGGAYWIPTNKRIVEGLPDIVKLCSVKRKGKWTKRCRGSPRKLGGKTTHQGKTRGPAKGLNEGDKKRHTKITI